MYQYILITIAILCILTAITIGVRERLTVPCGQMKVYHLKGKTSGPTVLMVGVTHGNEPAGGVALDALVHDLKTKIPLKRGELIVIPRVNNCGYLYQMRNHPITQRDLNRTYPNEKGENGSSVESRYVSHWLGKADMVLDLHEGYDFHKRNPQSIGSTLKPSPFGEAPRIAEATKAALNREITTDWKKFTLLNYHCDVTGTLSCYAYQIQKPYILLETSGQNDIQPMDVRVKQARRLMDITLQTLRMI